MIVSAGISLYALQLMTGLVLCSVGWYLRGATNWFHIRFLLDYAAFTGYCTTFTAITCPDYFTKRLLSIPATAAYLVLGFSLALHHRDMFRDDMIKKPHCYP